MTPYRFRSLALAPHRPAFAAGAAVLAASALWWAGVLLGARPAGPVEPMAAHAVVMSFGFMPFFFAGFVFTALPKWLRVPAPPVRTLARPLAAQFGGWVLFFVALMAPLPRARECAAAALALVTIGWAGSALALRRLVGTADASDRLHARLIGHAAFFGVATLAAAAFGLAWPSTALVRAAAAAALWGFVGTTFFVAAHRMIPFFSGTPFRALEPWSHAALLRVLVGAALVEAAAGAWAPFGALPAPLAATLGTVEAALGLALLFAAVRWRRVMSLGARFIAMLHLGFVWLGLAFALLGLSRGLEAATGGELTLGRAPLHAWTMGFLGSTFIAMVSRISCAQHRRAVVADALLWSVFWTLQAATLLRIAAALVALAAPALQPPLLAAAALAWAGGCGVWALRYARWYFAPEAAGARSSSRPPGAGGSSTRRARRRSSSNA